MFLITQTPQTSCIDSLLLRPKLFGHNSLLGVNSVYDGVPFLTVGMYDKCVYKSEHNASLTNFKAKVWYN